MSDPSAPDFDRIGDHYERYLPQIHAVSLALLDRLPASVEGERCLDIACGTGEPGLTLLRRHPQIELLGVDAAAGMIAVARRKAASEGLTARFEVMPFEAMPLADASFSRVLSRFGLLMFGDAARGAAELARLLVPGGRFSVAVWDQMRLNTLMSSTVAALGDHLPPELRPAFDRFDALAADGHRAELLRAAGLSRIETEAFHWTMDFPDFEHAWAMVAGPGVLHAQFSSLTPSALAAVQQRLRELLAPFADATGALKIPHTCRLFWGQR
jgi:ubiquinone/menaquinone biosynthesis C-methylase UbiE